MGKRICTVDGCVKTVNGHGLCNRHYYLMKTYRSTEDRRRYPPLEERFWAKVDKSQECWVWTAARNRKGYGILLVDGKNRQAHRVSYELANGPIPGDLQVDHICHNRACMKPAHLRLATRKQQMENLSGAQSNSKSGVRGVVWAPRQKRWQGTVGHNGKAFHVGFFKNIEDAENAVIKKRLELFTHNEVDRREAC